MYRTAVNRLTPAIAALLLAASAPWSRALDSIPLYDVLPISAMLAEQYPELGISSAASVNEDGDAVGFAIIGNYYKPFVYTPELGVMLLPELEGWNSHQALDTTDRQNGMLYIVGLAQSGIYAEPQIGVVWEFDTADGTATAAAVPPVPGGASSKLTDINNLLLAVGQSVHLGAQPMVYDHLAGTRQLVDLPSVPADINDLNTVAGDEWRAALSVAGDGTITAGAPEFLGVPPGGWWATINALNNDNSVAARAVMTYGDGAGRRMNGAARYEDGEGWRLLWVYSAFDSANGINDSGDVVGALGVQSAVRSALYIDALDSAYLLEDLIDPDSPYGYASSVADINNAGTIAAGGGAALLVSTGPMPPPTEPVNLTAVPHEPTWQQPWNAITLDWDNTSGLTHSFTVDRRIAGTPDWSVIRQGWSPTTMWDMDVGLGVTYDYRVSAAGLAGLSPPSNTATATAPSEPVDTEAPTVAITMPADGDNVSGRVKVRVEAADNIGVTYISVRITGNYYNQQLCTGSGELLECNWNTKKLENGVYTIQASASDAMGNGSLDSVQVVLGGDGGGDVFSMRVSDLNMQARTKRGVTTVKGNVVVTEGTGSPLRSVMVYGTWTLPGGGTMSRVEYTGRGGKATFEAAQGPGTYVLTITNLVKAGYTFDAANSVLSGDITVE